MQSGEARAWISLGGNMSWNGLLGGDLFAKAITRLGEGGFRPLRRSRLWRGPAWPDPSDPLFYNAVVEGAWGGSAPELLTLLLLVEAEFGRRRSVKNAPRTLDLDLLDMEGGRGWFPPDLDVPHPRLAARAFILGPLAEAAPDWRHPGSGFSAQELYEVTENKEDYGPVTENGRWGAEITANP